MDSFVTDTQALVKFMMGKKVINNKSHKAYQAADKGKSIIIIPAIVLMEMLYLFEKNRIDVGLLQTEELLKTASEIKDIPELHDRLIAATARYLKLPLITNDPVIKDSKFVKILK
jgi:predicted nucleic acid-binding protein